MKAHREGSRGQLLRLAKVVGHDRVTEMESLLPNGGGGLFATKTIRASAKTSICQYAGNFVDDAPADRGSYLFQIPDGRFIDGDPLKGFGALSNDPRDDGRVNAQLRWNGEAVMMYATEDIFAGEEIFISYGLEYWLHHIERLPQEERAAVMEEQAAAQKRQEQRVESRARAEPDTWGDSSSEGDSSQRSDIFSDNGNLETNSDSSTEESYTQDEDVVDLTADSAGSESTTPPATAARARPPLL